MDGRFLKEARRQAGWSQQRAATELGLSQSYLSMMETGDRKLTQDLARKVVRAYRLSVSSLPPSEERWVRKQVSPQRLAEELAALGYPGFAYLRRSKPQKHPGEVLLTALATEHLEARLFEALPWLVLRYWDIDKDWLVAQARVHNLQNRLGFVVSLARSAAHRSGVMNVERDSALSSLESMLSYSLLAREETLGRPVSNAELSWLRKHRSKQAMEWNLLTNWRPEVLRYAA